MILGQHEHYGAPHVLVRGTDGTKHLLPAWMTTPEAGATEVVAVPRLPVNRLLELRSVLDRIMIASSFGKSPLREDLTMKERRPLQSDFFITPPPRAEWSALQRAKALALLEALLAEANGTDEIGRAHV